MLAEYRLRFNNRTHKCEAVLKRCMELFDKNLFDKHDPTPLSMAMPDEYKSENIVESYRKFYASKPRVRYPEGKVPLWFKKYRGDQPYDIVN